MNAKKLEGLTKRQKAYLHTLIAKNGLSDAEYRDLLQEAAGVRSSMALDSDGLNRVLDRMEALGYEVDNRIRPGRTYGDRPGMATPKQLTMIDSLRLAVFGEKEKPFLRWLRHYHKASHPRFLTVQMASDAINGLVAMRERKSESKSNDQGADR